MKKLLVLFITLDFIFVSTILKINSEQERGLASSFPALTEGQQQKKEFIQSLQFQATAESFIVQTSYLQALCASYAHISLQFKAAELAVSGTPPTITSSFSCSQILNDPGRNQLVTRLDDFHAAHARKPTTGYVRAQGTFPDEAIEKNWQLSSLIVGGGNDNEAAQFTVNEAELLLFVDPTQLYIAL